MSVYWNCARAERAPTLMIGGVWRKALNPGIARSLGPSSAMTSSALSLRSARSFSRTVRRPWLGVAVPPPYDVPMFEKFLEMLNECEDVQEVYHNAQLPE